MKGKAPRVEFILRQSLCWVLVWLLAFPVSLWAQAPAPPTTPKPPTAAGTGLAPRWLVPPQYQPGVRYKITPGADYLLGSGDVIEVLLSGRLDVVRYKLVVGPAGTITIPLLGELKVAGLTSLETRRLVAQRASELFKFMEVAVAVEDVRTFDISITGEVENPGTIQVFAVQRLHEAVTQVGGITPQGSARHVRVFRDGKEKRYDLQRFERTGDLEHNPLVAENTVVVVPPRGPTISLLGSVVHPGDYEIGEDPLSLQNLLALAGGVPAHAAISQARLTRIGPDSKKETQTLDLTRLLSPGAPPFEVQGGDVLFVPPISVLQDMVEVRGALLGTGADPGRTLTLGRPTLVARVELASGDRLKDVILKSGGVAPYADFPRAFIERGGVSGPRQTIPVDLQRLLVDKDEGQNLALQNGDVFVVPVMEDKIYVIGNVRAPGGFDFRPLYSAKDYILLAGGPDRRAKERAATVKFPDGRIFRTGEAPPLVPGAVVEVPEVSVKWWEDYLLIASAVASIVTAYTGLYILFQGPLFIPAGEFR